MNTLYHFASSYVCAKFTEVLRGSNVTQKPVPFIIAMFTYGRISLEVKGVSHGKEDAAVLSLASQGNFDVRSKVVLKLVISTARSKFL